MNQQLKIGIIFIISCISLFWGINYLKGKNVFNSSKEFFVIYEKVGGLRKSNAVLINGFKVGVVLDIHFHPNHSGDVVVKFNLQNDFPFSSNSVVKVKSANLMGDKCLVIEPNDGNKLAISGDTLQGNIGDGMTEIFKKELLLLKDKISLLVVNMDSTLLDLRQVLNAKNKTNIEKIITEMSFTLTNLNKITQNFNQFTTKNKEKFNHIIGNIDTISTNLSIITDSLSQSKIKNTIDNLSKILVGISEGKGTLGKLIYDKSVYDKLNTTIKEMYLLLEDLKLNPSRYVNFSIFGGSKKYTPKKEK